MREDVVPLPGGERFRGRTRCARTGPACASARAIRWRCFGRRSRCEGTDPSRRSCPLASAVGGLWVTEGFDGNVDVTATPRDYDGDGRTDTVFFCPATASWYVGVRRPGGEPHRDGQRRPGPVDRVRLGEHDPGRHRLRRRREDGPGALGSGGCGHRIPCSSLARSRGDRSRYSRPKRQCIREICQQRRPFRAAR
jgi:hypothetical protein